ncbi:MAG: replication-associated recombination protein A [Clostridiales bacterium]|nr:replication-associated recombination protein A [Clostridiales bacterium]
MTLFDYNNTANQPLADRMRPRNLDEFIGQEHIVGPGKLLRRAILADKLTSSIFYGPPGCGKTSLAYVIAQMTKAAFVRMNAVTSGVAEVREVLKEADDRRKMYGKATYLLLDECHRWNKAQSDSILPAIEEGLIRFIGSTTENPMIAMTPAIVSRCRLFAFEPLSDQDVRTALERAIVDEQNGVGQMHVRVDEDALNHWVQTAGGDIRMALNALELATLSTPTQGGEIRITLEIAEDSIQKPVIKVDDSLYYDMLSAFCKSLRGSDADAALLWFSRLLYAGADPRLIARRLIAHASEDVGLANPNAMLQAVAAAQALEFVGLPEARLSLSQAIIAICESPKSNSVVMAMIEAKADAEKGNLGAVPEHLRDAHYAGHQRINDTSGYLYPHDFPGHWVKQTYMPEGFEDTVYYRPGSLGFEGGLRRSKDEHGPK